MAVLTCVRQPIDRICLTAARVLLARMEGLEPGREEGLRGEGGRGQGHEQGETREHDEPPQSLVACSVTTRTTSSTTWRPPPSI